VGRHEALRTVIVEGQQRILADAKVEVPLIPVGEEELTERINRAAAHVLDLANEIPLRASVLELPTAWVVVLVIHHVAGDGWSMGPLARDLSQAYRARMTGDAPDWRPLPVQYADYTLWQRELLDAVQDEQVEHWRGILDGAPAETTLPTDRPRPAVASHEGGAVDVRLPAEVHNAVARLARNSSATVFMVLQAALAVCCRGWARAPTSSSARRRPAGSTPPLMTWSVLREHGGVAGRPVGPADLRRGGVAGAVGRPRRLRPPGRAVRAARGGTRAGAFRLGGTRCSR